MILCRNFCFESFVDSSAHKVSVVPGVLLRHSFSALNVMTILEPEMAGEASRRKSAFPTGACRSFVCFVFLAWIGRRFCQTSRCKYLSMVWQVAIMKIIWLTLQILVPRLFLGISSTTDVRTATMGGHKQHTLLEYMYTCTC